MTGRELLWNVTGQDVPVRIEQSKDRGVFHVADRGIPFQVVENPLDGVSIEIDGKRHLFYIVRDGNQFSVWHNGRTYQLSRIPRAANSHAGSTAATGDITALMPGKILRIEAAVGDAVTEKQPVVVMESMKMETALHAPKSGRIAEIRCRPGQVVDMGEVLIVIE